MRASTLESSLLPVFHCRIINHINGCTAHSAGVSMQNSNYCNYMFAGPDGGMWGEMLGGPCFNYLLWESAAE